MKKLFLAICLLCSTPAIAEYSDSTGATLPGEQDMVAQGILGAGPCFCGPDGQVIRVYSQKLEFYVGSSGHYVQTFNYPVVVLKEDGQPLTCKQK